MLKDCRRRIQPASAQVDVLENDPNAKTGTPAMRVVRSDLPGAQTQMSSGARKGTMLYESLQLREAMARYTAIDARCDFVCENGCDVRGEKTDGSVCPICGETMASVTTLDDAARYETDEDEAREEGYGDVEEQGVNESEGDEAETEGDDERPAAVCEFAVWDFGRVFDDVYRELEVARVHITKSKVSSTLDALFVSRPEISQAWTRADNSSRDPWVGPAAAFGELLAFTDLTYDDINASAIQDAEELQSFLPEEMTDILLLCPRKRTRHLLMQLLTPSTQAPPCPFGASMCPLRAIMSNTLLDPPLPKTLRGVYCVSGVDATKCPVVKVVCVKPSAEFNHREVWNALRDHALTYHPDIMIDYKGGCRIGQVQVATAFGVRLHEPGGNKPSDAARGRKEGVRVLRGAGGGQLRARERGGEDVRESRLPRVRLQPDVPDAGLCDRGRHAPVRRRAARFDAVRRDQGAVPQDFQDARGDSPPPHRRRRLAIHQEGAGQDGAEGRAHEQARVPRRRAVGTSQAGAGEGGGHDA